MNAGSDNNNSIVPTHRGSSGWPSSSARTAAAASASSSSSSSRTAPRRRRCCCGAPKSAGEPFTRPEYAPSSSMRMSCQGQGSRVVWKRVCVEGSGAVHLPSGGQGFSNSASAPQAQQP